MTTAPEFTVTHFSVTEAAPDPVGVVSLLAFLDLPLHDACLIAGHSAADAKYIARQNFILDDFRREREDASFRLQFLREALKLGRVTL